MVDWKFMLFGVGKRQAADYIECLERVNHAWMARTLVAEENLHSTEARLTDVIAERDALEQQVTALQRAAAVQPVRPVLPITFPEHEELGREPLVRVRTLWDLQKLGAGA